MDSQGVTEGKKMDAQSSWQLVSPPRVAVIAIWPKQQQQPQKAKPNDRPTDTPLPLSSLSLPLSPPPSLSKLQFGASRMPRITLRENIPPAERGAEARSEEDRGRQPITQSGLVQQRQQQAPRRFWTNFGSQG